MDEAERTDRSDDDDGQSLPDEIARRQRLRAKMQQARADLEARAKARAKVLEAELQENARKKKQQGCKTRDRKIQPPKQTPEDREQANLTDADSRLMRKSTREAGLKRLCRSRRLHSILQRPSRRRRRWFSVNPLQSRISISRRFERT